MSKTGAKLTNGLLVALLFGGALYLRIYFPFDKVFTDGGIKFTGNDAYYIMRLVDNLVANFPHLSVFDPYLLYPGGAEVPSIHFFARLLASIAWVVGLGSPSQQTIDAISVYYPAVLGALTVIPVYFIGRELFGRWAGVLAAALIALLPGEFLGRSILGNTDYHVAETLFTTIIMLFLFLAIKTAREKELTFSHIRHRDWATSARPLVYSLLAGFAMGIYLLTWAGGLLFVFIISAYFVIQSIIDHLRGKPTDYLSLVGVILFLVAGLLYFRAALSPLYLASVVIALLVPLVLNGVSRLMVLKEATSADYLRSKSADYVPVAGVVLLFGTLSVLAVKGLYLAFMVTALLVVPVLSVIYGLMVSRKMKPAYYPLTLLGLALVGLAIFYFVAPSLLRQMLNLFTVFHPTGASLTTIEMEPLLYPQGTFTFQIAWGNFPGLLSLGAQPTGLTFRNILAFMTTTVFLSFISLAILTIYFVIKQGSAEKSLLLVWSLVILAATLGQRRFAYYLAVNVALLTGYLSVLMYYILRFIIDYLRGARISYMSWRVLELPNLEEVSQPVGTTARVERRRAEREERKRAKRMERGRASSEGGSPITARQVSILLGAIAIFFLVFFPNIQPARATARQAPFAITDAWLSSLSWLKENTPEPFGNPDFYYRLETDSKYRSLYALIDRVPNPSGDPDFYHQLKESYPYPESAYGVMSWWDYGYWITRVAHRIPNANPSQNPGAIRKVAAFFTAQDEESASTVAREMGSKYIIIDSDAAIGKFYAIVIWARKQTADFFDVYLLEQEANRFTQQVLIHSEYYRSLSARLYNFDGKAVTPKSTRVISWEERRDKDNNIFKVVMKDKDRTFASYAEAEAYLAGLPPGNHRIVGTDPFSSPVPLDPLEHYRLVYGSAQGITMPGGGTVPSVKIFEYAE